MNSTENRRLLGRISYLQIQREPLKHGPKETRWYDPTALWSVEALTLTPQGAGVSMADGTFIYDVHNILHPATRQATSGKNAFSLGFTSHYAVMQGVFGAHLALALAGEQMIVERAAAVTLADVAGGVRVTARGGGREIHLAPVVVAAPCVAFTRFCLQVPRGEGGDPEVVQTALAKLNDGVRGFYLRLAEGEAGGEVELGAEVWALG